SLSYLSRSAREPGTTGGATAYTALASFAAATGYGQPGSEHGSSHHHGAAGNGLSGPWSVASGESGNSVRPLLACPPTHETEDNISSAADSGGRCPGKHAGRGHAARSFSPLRAIWAARNRWHPHRGRATHRSIPSLLVHTFHLAN